MGLGMDLLASTFDVESVVFPKRGTLFGFLWGWRETLGCACWRQLSMSKVWYSLCGADTFSYFPWGWRVTEYRTFITEN